MSVAAPLSRSPTAPTWWQAAIALSVIAAAVYVLVFYAAVFWFEDEPMALAGVIFFGPFCYLIAAWQYRGTFRAEPQAARRLGILMYVLGGMCLLMYATNVGEYYQKHGFGSNPTAILVELSFVLAPATVGLVLGRINQLHARRLNTIYSARSELRPRFGVTLRDGLVGLTIVGLVGGIVAYQVHSHPPRSAEHVTAAAAGLHLPEGASDVSYCHGSRGTIAYEFTTDELRFRNWVDSGIGSIESELTKAALEEITAPYMIDRYLDLVPNRPGIDEAEIRTGLKYEWRFEDRGVHAAFDRATGRGYYYAHYH